MQIEKINSKKLAREYDVTIPAADISKKLEKRLSEIGGKMKVPGFRPGKAPISLVKKNYGQQVLGEIIEQTIGSTAAEALEKEKLRPAMRPKYEIVSYKDDGDLKYKMKFEIIPEVPEINFEKIKIEKLSAEPSENEVNEGLERLTKLHKNFVKIPEVRGAKMGHAVVMDFKGFIDGEAFEGGTAQDFQLELGSKQFIEGFEEQLIGLKAGDEKKVNVAFPQEYHAKQFAGKPAIFEVKIKEVQEPKAAEINDEFSKKFGLESVDKLKEAMKKQVESDFNAIAKTLLKKELFDALEKKCDFDIPQDMLEAEFETIWKQAEQVRKNDPELSKKSEEKAKKEYRKMAERRVKLGIFLAELGRKNNIQVSNQELSALIMERAREFPGQEQKVVDFYTKTPGAMEELKGPIIENKMVDFILEKVSIKEKKTSPKDLLAAAEKLEKEAEIMNGASDLAHSGHHHHDDEDDYEDEHHVHGPGCNH